MSTKIAFSLPSLQEIKLVGPDKQVHLHMMCLQRDHKQNIQQKCIRSKDFMTELERASTKKYFACFKMHLSEALEDVDINEDFKCKWKELEAALNKTIGKEQNITRLSNFFDKRKHRPKLLII